MDRRIFGGGPNGSNGPEWRLIRLADLRESAWQGTGAAGVTDVEQDADGWITASVDDESGGAKTLILRDAAGREYDPATKAWGWVELLLEPDATTWSGTNGEYVYVGLADDDGDISATKYAFLMINTQSDPLRKVILNTGSDESATIIGSFNWRASALVMASEFGIGAIIGSVFRAGMTPVRILLKDGPIAPTAPIRLVLSLGVTENVGAGPYDVKFRAWYRVYPAPSEPFP